MNDKELEYQNKLVENFNNKFSEGDVIRWRPDTFSIRFNIKIKSVAFMDHGFAVTGLEGIDGLCGIDEHFVDYDYGVVK